MGPAELFRRVQRPEEGDLGATDCTKWAVFDRNRVTAIAQIRDGTSNTLCIAESLTGPEGYGRGFFWSDQACGALAFTELAPNSPLPDRCYPTVEWCLNLPEQNLPSVWGDGSTTDTCAARSRHPGGVQVLMADGSVHFINDTIDLSTWRALATIAGGEVAAKVLIYDF